MERRGTMPAFDGTGPLGQGPMTGRGRGYCMTYRRPGYGNAYGGFGFGRGRRNRFWATGLPGWQRNQAPYPGYAEPQPSKEERLEMLKEEAKYFENALNEINEEIKKMEESKE
jgi:hypothetical protein